MYPTIPEVFQKTIGVLKEAGKEGKLAVKIERLIEAPKAGLTDFPFKILKELSFSALDEASALFSLFLYRSGLGPKDKVAIVAKPAVGSLIALLGTWRLGAVAVPIDPELKKELPPILRKSEAKLVIVDGDKEISVPRWMKLVEISQLESERFLAASPTTLGEAQAILRSIKISPKDLSLILFTSGTTGEPKGVMLSHENLLSNWFPSAERLKITADDVILSIAPWHHIMGMTCNVVGMLAAGFTLIYTDDYPKIPQLLKEENVTAFLGVPKLYRVMYDRLKKEIFSKWFGLGRLMYWLFPQFVGMKVKSKLVSPSFRFFVSGSAPLWPKVFRFFQRLGLQIVEGYGLTETSPVLTVAAPGEGRPGSVGKPLPGVELKIHNPDKEGIGEVVVRGPNVMLGYYKEPALTEQVIEKDGWFHTGDLGHLDKEGNLYLKGRKKNMIVLSTGKNVYPEEVEHEISSIPEVEQVLVKSGKIHGEETVVALVYPHWASFGIEDPQRIKKRDLRRARDILWPKVKEACNVLAPYKRVKKKEDLIILKEPLPETLTSDIKRHLVKIKDEELVEV